MRTFPLQKRNRAKPCHGLFPGLVWQKAVFPALLAFFSLSPRLEAHPVSLTSVFVNVENEIITAELNMLVEDLVLYYWMESDENFRFSSEDLRKKAIEHQEFFLRHFHLRDRDGNRLEGEIVEIDFSELNETGIHIDDLMAYGIRYHFEFPFDEPPEFLTVSQDFGGDGPAIPAEMAVRFFHHEVQMEAVMLSHGTAHTIGLDWEAGWEHAQDDLDAARERLRLRQEDTLGITSYSSVYSYVYITDTEVRHELLIPLLTLETWLPLERDNPDIMTVAEQNAAGEAVASFLTRHNRIKIDGAQVTPKLERLNFFGPEFKDFARQAPARDVSVYNTRVGVILSFPAHEPPARMNFEWDYFNERLPFLKPAIYVFEEGKEEAVLNSHRTVFEWENEDERDSVQLLSLGKPEPPPNLYLPVLSLSGGGAALMLAVAGFRCGPSRRRLTCVVIAGGLAIGAIAARPYARAAVPHPFASLPEISEEKTQSLFETLHRNIYRAFEFRDEERIYDALDQSVSGQLLEDLYLQILENLTVEKQGGAVSRISEIELLEGKQQPLPGSSTPTQAFTYRSAWTVTGAVEHWGHVHTRKNQYEAVFTVEGLPSGWKITGFKPLQEERLEQQIRLRQ